MSNNYIFFSNQCQHSIRLINTINKSDLGGKINLCNIDNPQIQIPEIIQAVPSLYLGSERKVLSGQELFSWINTQINTGANSNVLQNQEVTGDNSVSAFQENELGANFSDSYSFIESNDNSTALNHSFSFLGNENAIPNHTKSAQNVSSENNNSGGGGQKGSVMDKAYEQLINQRNNEVPKPISQGRI